MNKITFFILLAFLSLRTYGQIGLINDPDGFTNLRQEPTTKSEILYQVKEYEVFFIDVDYLDLKNDWILVHIPQNKYSKHNSDGTPYDLNGYIHKSRIRKIEDLPIDNSSKVKLIFKVIKADPNKEVNQEAYGLDIPLSMSYEVEDLTLVYNDEPFSQSDELYSDLFNVAFELGNYESTQGRFITYLLNDTYFIRQKCADGGGYYEIIWVIRNGKIIQRLAGWII